MSSEVVAMATDSSSMTDMTSQPLLAPSATCPTRILECPCLAIPECHRCERGAARGNSSLLQSPAAGVDSHAPVDSETDLTLAAEK